MQSQEGFLRQLREVFAQEAEEHLSTLLEFIMAAERSGSLEDRTGLQNAFRAAHSLKGAARAVDLTDIESLCHGIENTLAPLYRGDGEAGPDAIGSLGASIEKLERLIRPEAGPVAEAADAPRPADAPQAAAPQAHAAGTTKIRTERLEKILADAEELIPLKLAIGERVSELKKMAMASGEAAVLARKVEEDFRRLETLSDRLLSNAHNALILPSSYLTAGLPKLVRDLARDLGKEVDLVIEDDGIEFEKSVLEGLKDPLVHLLRNAVDHGIEQPQARASAGKPRRGTIRLSIQTLAGGEAEVKIADDGAGIAADLSEKIFLPGFSTRSEVSGVSGRGMGLAIVKEGIENLGGSVILESRPGSGTVFSLRAPSARATFDGVVVAVSGRKFILPATSLASAIRVAQGSVIKSRNAEAITVEGRACDLVHLGDLLGIPRTINPHTAGYFPVVIIESGSGRAAFIVDEILDSHEVLVKPLGDLMPRVKGILGVAVLGSGEILPVLYPRDLVHGKMGRSLPSAGTPDTAAKETETVGSGSEVRRKAILVVEDSITSRMLLKSIFESAGYAVAVANDGLEGLTALKTDHFDLVVSDIEMPRMNGFELTQAIRAEPNLARTPVILVTSLEQREHREKGVAAGANAYISKSNFAQSNLLETVARFI